MANIINQPIDTEDVRDYSIIFTCDFVADSIIESMQADINDSTINRWAKDNIVILSYLFRKILYIEDGYLNQIKDDINKNEDLKMFAFLLSSQREFGYNRSYIVSKIERMGKFYLEFNRFMRRLIEDINFMISKLVFENYINLIVNDFIIFSYNRTNGQRNVKLVKNKFDSILTLCGEKYSIKVILDEMGECKSERTLAIGTVRQKIRTVSEYQDKETSTDKEQESIASHNKDAVDVIQNLINVFQNKSTGSIYSQSEPEKLVPSIDV